MMMTMIAKMVTTAQTTISSPGPTASLHIFIYLVKADSYVDSIGSPYWITVSNASSVAQRSLESRQDQDDDDERILTSPANGTVLAPGAYFNFEYTCDDGCDSVRLALVRLYRVLTGTATEVRGDDRYVSATVTVPEDIPADS